MVSKGRLPIKKIIILVLLVLASLFFINKYYNNTSENCIVWEENHFKTTSCSTKNTIDNSIYNININKFKKIEVTKETTFFKNGKPLIWYGKSASGKVEFFTFRGIHPETLKELNPITEYIINKYVLTNKKDKTIL